ncbi:hypothetical protein IKG60_02605 [Candidatus Saccharibacteria bacterium]|nr:hypothetical protein [Candidatus Saccharibacteria bacterium]
MAQTKRKTATKTAKKTTAKRTQCRKKTCCRAAKKQQGVTNEERMHIFFVTAMALVAGALLCADAAMMMV